MTTKIKKMPKQPISVSREVEVYLKGIKIDAMDDRWRTIDQWYGETLELRRIISLGEEKGDRHALKKPEREELARKESSIINLLKEIRRERGMSFDLPTESTVLST